MNSLIPYRSTYPVYGLDNRWHVVLRHEDERIHIIYDEWVEALECFYLYAGLQRKQAVLTINDAPPCPVCHGGMLPMLGAGWDYDRFVCGARGCDGEIVLETSTLPPGLEDA